MIAHQTTRLRLVDLDMLRCAGCAEPLTAGNAGELAHSDGTELCLGRDGHPVEAASGERRVGTGRARLVAGPRR